MRLILSAIRFFDRQPKPLIILLALASLVPLSILGSVTRYEAFFGFLYLAPISFVTWHVGPRWGAFFSILCAGIWAFASLTTETAHVPPWGIHWNTVTRLAVFLLVTILVSGLRTAQDREAALARTDALTGAANSRSFREQLDREILRCQRYRHPFSVIYGDLDNFKNVNDLLGHAVGDTLLQNVTESMHRSIRNTDVVARLGGDEFAVLLPETDEDAANLVAQQLRQNVLDTVRRHALPIGSSFGVVTCVDPPASADAVLQLADELMYAAKREGASGIRRAVVTRHLDREPAGDFGTVPSSNERKHAMRRTKPAEAAIIGREHLVRVLLEHLERTFSTEGMPGATRMMEQLLLRLEETALREYAYQHGLTTEYDVEPEADEPGGGARS